MSWRPASGRAGNRPTRLPGRTLGWVRRRCRARREPARSAAGTIATPGSGTPPSPFTPCPGSATPGKPPAFGRWLKDRSQESAGTGSGPLKIMYRATRQLPAGLQRPGPHRCRPQPRLPTRPRGRKRVTGTGPGPGRHCVLTRPTRQQSACQCLNGPWQNRQDDLPPHGRHEPPLDQLVAVRCRMHHRACLAGSSWWPWPQPDQVSPPTWCHGHLCWPSRCLATTVV